ncbi:flagellar basal body rod C-terminal domain-containing protein [uncultured Mobiluncus sp.]|uniref:flagellar hook-associated protein FlgK n=1 Tax=uncultured Mobiluncus sp. TaxID=293425 RepID=UPI002805EAF6|nr:flagellar basal body rod C-terminal domain-containing protein [uncultured Mobiluncus sp.]
MGSTFSSLNAGLTGLYAAQRLIEVSGQNINNMNTPGYTRQRVDQKALGIGSEPSIWAGSVPQGGGVEITGESRLGDFFLDAKLRLETGRAASAKQVSQSWKAIEASMDELGKMSVSNSLREFYKSWGDVNNSSDNRGARSTAIGNAQALVTQIQTGYTHISDQWKNARHELEAHVSDLNATMDSVVNLNDRIRRGTLVGQNVNHLIDERDKLALHISELTGATVRKSKAIYTKENAPHPSMIGTAYEDGTIEIMLSGNSLVGKDYANHFVVSGSYDMPGIDAAPREMYQKSVDALTAGGKSLDAIFTRNGVEIQKYQAKVSVYTDKDAPDPSKVGHKYVAFYDMEDNGKKVGGTDQEFALGDFHRDEGPVRLTWDIGGHEIAIKEGVIGGIAQNLRPAEIPGVSGTIGKGGSWAEAGKLYNDVATNIATEVNAIHANDGGKNNTKTLLTKEVTFKLADLSKDTNDPDRLVDANVTIKRSDYKTDELFDRAVQDKVAELEKGNPGHAAIYETVKEDGGDFFKFAATDNKLPAAMRLKVAITDPQAIAAGVEVGGIYDGSVALRLGGQQDSPTSALNEWGKSVVDIGVHASGASDKYNLAEQTRQIAEQQQKSQSSVDMNEEVMNLIRGQHAYAGAARITSTVNQMLETLINLGR